MSSPHSKAEMQWVAGMMAVHGRVVTVQSVLDCIRAGDVFLRSDALIGPGDVLEYDELHWHGDVQRDVRKTTRLMEHGARRIVRLRRGCAPLKPLLGPVDGDACVYVDVVVETMSTYEQVMGTAKALQCDPPHRSVLLDAISIGKLAFEERDARTQAALAHLTTLLGAHAATRVYETHGVKTRLYDVTFRDGLEWLIRDVLGGDASKLQTMMCDSVASRLHDSTFRDGLQWLLRDVLGNDASKLQTIMCDSVAVRLHDSTFRDALQWLVRDVLGNDASKLQTIMCNSVAARLQKPTFREGLLWLLRDVLCNDASKLASLMCGCLAAHIHSPDFRNALDDILRLARECHVDAYATLTCLVRKSPFVKHVAAIRERMISNPQETLRGLHGTNAKKRKRLAEWGIAM